MGQVRESIIAVAKNIPWVKPPLRFIERVAYYRRCYCIGKWETSLPEQAEADLKNSGYIARIGSEGDLDRLAHTETWRSCALYRQWLSVGKQILLLEKDAEIMSYVWLDFNPEFAVEQVPEIRFRLSPDTYYSDEAYTPVAYRGLGLRRLSFIAELLFAKKQGYRFMVSYFLDDSALANGIRNFTRTGNPMGKIIKEVHLLKIAGIRFSWLKDLARDESIVRIQ
jgi:hypothetical protein